MKINQSDEHSQFKPLGEDGEWRENNRENWRCIWPIRRCNWQTRTRRVETEERERGVDGAHEKKRTPSLKSDEDNSLCERWIEVV